jgi:4-diphosphocytidyl-2-C-methyl-D-erythritol kinase
VATRAVIESFAKINLYLEVICKRPDGYHNIETIFQTISLSDALELELTSAGVEIRCNDPAVPTDERNLAYRAFLAMRDVVDYRGGIRIEMKKRIPPGSGLGGGSSNAAATLVVLNHLLRAGLTDGRLREVGRDIGADVPFFITGGMAAAWQIGDRLRPLPALPESFVVVAVPNNVMVPTPRAYGGVAVPECKGPMPERFSECSDRLKGCVEVLDSRRPASMGDAARTILFNRLEEPVFSEYPDVAEVKAQLLEAGAAGALMSGSGSAVFGLAESSDHAGAMKRAVERAASCRCFVAHTVNSGSIWRPET